MADLPEFGQTYKYYFIVNYLGMQVIMKNFIMIDPLYLPKEHDDYNGSFNQV